MGEEYGMSLIGMISGTVYAARLRSMTPGNHRPRRNRHKRPGVLHRSRHESEIPQMAGWKFDLRRGINQNGVIVGFSEDPTPLPPTP